MVAVFMVLWTMFTPARAAETVILSADLWCPHTCDPASGHDGYMVDIAREALALAGLKSVYQVRPWATALSEIRSGLSDGLVGTLPNEVPDLPRNQLALGHQANAFVVRADDPFVLTGLDSLDQRRIGAVKDYSYSPAIDTWLALHRDQVMRQSGTKAAIDNLEKLMSGRVDVVVDDEAVLRHGIILGGYGGKVRIAGRMPGGSLHVTFSLLRRPNSDLPQLLDDGIAKLRASGRLADILAGYGLADWDPKQ